MKVNLIILLGECKGAFWASLWLVFFAILAPNTVQGQFFDNQTFSTLVIKDVSESLDRAKLDDNIDPVRDVAYMLHTFDISHDEPSANGAQMLFMNIGLPFIPKIEQAFVEPSKYWYLNSSKERVSAQQAFRSHATKLFIKTYDFPSDDATSNLYRGIAYGLRYMDHNADVRKVIIYSDLLENNVIDLGQYADNPSGLMKDYDILRQALLKADALSKDYAGLHMILVVPGKSELVYEATRFWERFFGEFGIVVETKATYLN